MAHLNLPPTIRILRSITMQKIIVKDNLCEGRKSFENDYLYYLWRYVHTDTYIYVVTYVHTHTYTSNTYTFQITYKQKVHKLKKNPFNMQVDLNPSKLRTSASFLFEWFQKCTRKMLFKCTFLARPNPL